MLNLQIQTVDVARYLAILLRLSLVVFLIPPFNSPRYPAVAKALFVMLLTTMLFPLLRDHVAPLSFHPAALVLTVASEILFALLLSLSLLIITGAFEFAGELISYQAGMSMAQVVDPQGGFQISVVSNLIELFALLLFFALNGHHVILKILVESFQTLPVGQFFPGVATIDRLVLGAGWLFIIALKLAAPVLVVLFLIQVGLGVFSKFVPNINILMTSFPITILFGLFFTGLALPYWGPAILQHFRQVLGFMQSLVQIQSSML